MIDRLDSLLKDWSSRSSCDDKALSCLEREIAMKARELRYISSAALQGAPAFSPWGRLAWFSMGATVALAVALVFVRLPTPANNPAAPKIVQSSESVHSLFKEVNRLFAGNLRWVAQSDGAMELGIDPDKDESARDCEPFAVHIAVVSRAVNDGPWKTIWESDILTRSEQAIDITPNRKRDDRVALWIFPVADGRFAVDSRLSLDAPFHIYSDTSDVVEDGKPTRIAMMTIGAREYRVYQTVVRLKANVGAVHNRGKSTADCAHILEQPAGQAKTT